MISKDNSVRGLGHDGRIMFVGMATTQGAFGSYQTLWPLYIAALGATPSQIGLVLGVTGVIRLIALLPSGVLADRIGLKRSIVGGQAAMALALVAYAVVHAWWQLIPAGLILAMGTATFPSVLAKIAAIAGDGPDRSRRFTMINTVAPAIGLLLAPVVGGVIAAQISLRVVFIFAAILVTTAMVLFSGLSSGAERRMTDTNASYQTTLRQPAILRWCLIEMSAIFCLALGMSFIPNYLHSVQGISDGVIGSFASLSAGGSMALGLLVNRVGYFRQPLHGIGLALASAALAFALVIVGNQLPFFVAAYVLLGGFFATWTLFESALGGVAAQRYHARAYAIAEILSGAGYALAPFLAGFLYELDPRAPLVGGLCLTMLLIIAMMTVMRTTLTSTLTSSEALT